MIIINTVRDLHVEKKIGGVGNYYSILLHYWKLNVSLFFIGKRHMDRKHILVRLISDYVKLNRIINQADLLITNTSLSSTSLMRDAISLLLAFRKRKKTIVFFRGWHDNMVSQIDNNRFIKMMFKKTYGKADAIIVLSVAFQEKLRQWGFRQPIYIETTVVDDSLLKTENGKSQIMLNDPIKLLFLARVEKEKGIWELIDAYELLRHQNQKISLTIAGDGSQLNNLKQCVIERQIPDVKFTGYISGKDKAKAFYESDIYVFPSHGEGMPNSVLEAIAFGLPVITRSVGGLNDFFEDGKMGYITDSKDPEVLSHLMEKLLVNRHLRNEMASYNRAFAQRHFIASKVVRRLERIYREVLENNAEDSSWRNY